MFFLFSVMDTSKRGYKLIQLTKQSTVLQDVSNTVDNNQHLELGNSKDQQPKKYDDIEDTPNYDLLEECRLTQELFNNENILFDSSVEISTSFVNKILEGEDNFENNIDRNKNLQDGESLTRIDNNEDGNKNVLKFGRLDTAIENNGNINEDEDLDKAENNDSSFEVEQEEEEENDLTDADGEASDHQGLQLEEGEQENISVDGNLDNEAVSRKRKKKENLAILKSGSTTL